MASLKAAGRAFSFGRKKAESSAAGPRPVIEHALSDGRAQYSRERTHTESSYASQSTATPPKLLDTGLDFGSTDNFGTMFDDIGNRQSQTELDKAVLGFDQVESPGAMTPAAEQNNHGHSNFAPTPLQAGTSPRSWVSQGSQDDLISRHSPAMGRTFSYEDGQENIDGASQRTKSRTMSGPGPSSPSYRKKQQRPPSDGLRRSSVYVNKKEVTQDPAQFHDDDAKLVMESINASRRLDIGGLGSYQESDEEKSPTASLVHHARATPTQYFTSGAQQYSADGARRNSPWGHGNHTSGPSASQPETSAVPRAKKFDISLQEERSMFDISPPPSAGLASSSRPKLQAPPMPQTQNKIMTPAQFERYRKEQEMNRVVNQQSSHNSSDDEGDDYDDDDELEHTKQLAKARRKQEAHLAIYRQQMMKVTGEQPSDLPSINLRPSIDRSSMSTPILPTQLSGIDVNFDKPSADGKVSDDEDDDVPLGVLAAHGFPSRNRPPNAMSSKDSRIQYKSESYPPPPASSSGASQSGRASGLPPFAKHLPQDPYFGASLVNPTNRESLMFGHQGPGSSLGAPTPSMPPGGLVGVIAGEEKAKAARRGSPNTHGNYGSPLPLSMTQSPGMPPGMPPMMSPGEQATVQMSEQMNQMMQMQMQWMQQMQQMMASGMQMPSGQQQPMLSGHHPMMTPPILQAPSPFPAHRPLSSGPQSAPGVHGGQMPGGRAMSMMSPSSTAPWPPQHGNFRRSVAPSTMGGALNGPKPGYSPSIAPSERSNVGNPSRYRPVSVAPMDEHQPRSQSRTSTINSNILHPLGSSRDNRQSTSRDRKSNLSLRPSAAMPARKTGSDEDDEEGWEEMKKKREKKKSVWRLNKKKGQPAAEAAELEYYDYSEI